MTLNEKMQTMIGWCSSCGVQVMDLTKKGAKRFLPNYREHYVELSDRTLMRVGVCEDCRSSLTSGPNVAKTADKILKNHKTYWKFNGRRESAYKDLKIEDPNTDELKFRRNRQLRKHQEEEAKQKKDLDKKIKK